MAETTAAEGPTILLEVREAVAWLTLNRPERLNSFTTRMHEELRAALEEVQSRGLADKIHPDEYAGCYYPRFIAGSTTLSNHAFGLALERFGYEEN